MKNNKIFTINLILIFLFSACSESANVKNISNLNDLFSFEYNDSVIYLDEYTNSIIAELGPAWDYYEVDSCSFDGTAKMYAYNGFEISTYQKSGEDKDRVFSIDLTDDSVSTSEGISIGQTFEDMIRIYGKDYYQLEGLERFYQYIKNNTILSFTFQNGIITAISYKVSEN